MDPAQQNRILPISRSSDDAELLPGEHRKNVWDMARAVTIFFAGFALISWALMR